MSSCKDGHFRVNCFIPVCATRSFLKDLHLYHEFETDCPNLVCGSILFVLCTQFVKLGPYGDLICARYLHLEFLTDFDGIFNGEFAPKSV